MVLKMQVGVIGTNRGCVFVHGDICAANKQPALSATRLHGCVHKKPSQHPSKIIQTQFTAPHHPHTKPRSAGMPRKL
jgi:hypothetical protein